MEDISIELLEKIQKEFEEEFTKSKRLEGIYKRIFEGTADYEEAHQFAIAIGDMLQGILEKHMVAEKMPNGKIYQNIAEKILRPTLKNNYELTTDVTTAVQSLINTSKGINIQSMVPEFPEDKVEGIILNTVNENKLSTDVVSTFTQSIVDSAVEANFSFATEAGLKPIPKRIVMGDCCDWCKEVAGKVDPDADLYEIGFYRRHKSCKCLVLMDYGRHKESVYSKQQYETVGEALAGEHAYLGALDKLTRQQRYDRKNAAYRAYYRNKRLQNGKTYKARDKAERGKDYEDAVLKAQRETIERIRKPGSADKTRNIPSYQKIDYVVAAKLVKDDAELIPLLMSNDVAKIATAINRILDRDFRLPKSVWNSKCILVENGALGPKTLGIADWDRSIKICEKAKENLKIHIHENLHTRSVIRADKDAENLYKKWKRLEEGSIEYLARTICNEYGITFIGSYEDYVKALKRIKQITSPLESDLDFNLKLIDRPLGSRYTYIEEIVNEHLSNNNVREVTKTELKNALNTLKGGDKK